MKNSFYIYFDGEKYISSKQVAALTGYAKDYIGQLCRLEKIKCQRSGRDWLVSEKSILNYKIKLSRLNEPTYVKTTADLGYLIRPLVFTAIFMTVITGFVLNLGSISKLTYQMKNDVTFPELPELSFPEIVLPKIALPQFSLPEIPKITFPKLAIPKIALPTKLSIPEISLPEISLTSLPSLPSLPSMPTLPKISFSLPEIRPLKVSLPSFSLAELFLPDFTLPKFSLPDLPTLSLPDFPKLSLPEIVLPKITLPKFPSWSFARLSLPFLDFSPPAEAMLQALRAGFPKISLPKVSFSLPEMHLPKIILALLPSLPDFSLPQITFPELPKLSLPKIVLPKIALPQFSLPEIPKITFPKLPFSLVLSLPSLPSLSFTKISPPSLPKMRLPDIHPFALKDIKDGFLGNLISWKDGFGAVSKISFSLPPPETHFSKIPKLSLLKLPDFSLPQITFPELPKLSLPEIPEITFPKLAMPKIVLPEFSLPKFSLPDFEFLKLSLPEFKLLELALPQFNLPNIEDLLGLIKIPTSPKLSWPNFSLPRISLPSFSLARLNSLRARLAALPPLPFTWEDSRLAILDIKNRFLEKLFSWKGYLASLDGDIKTEVADLPAGQAETPPPQIPSSNGGENEGSKIITFNTPSSPSFQTPPPQVKEIKTVVERVLSGISQSTLDQRLSDLNDSILLQVKNSLALIEKRIPSNQVQNPVVFLTTSIPGPSYNSPPQTGSGVSASFGDFSSGISTGGNLTASGNIILGQDTKTVDITSNTWKITSAGAASGFTSLSTDSLSASTFNVSGLLTTGGFISTASSTVVGNFTNQNATTTGYLAVTGMATSTFSNGIRLTGGCFLLLDGTCAGAGSGGITSLGGLTGATQTFSANGPLTISSAGTVHTFNASSSPFFGAIFATSTLTTSAATPFIFLNSSTSTIPSNAIYAWSFATSTTAQPLLTFNTNGPRATTTINQGFSIDSGAFEYDSTSGVTSFDAANTGPMAFDNDAGILTWIDMPSSTTTAGLVNSYSAMLDSTAILTIYGTTTTAGNILYGSVGIGTTSPNRSSLVVGWNNSRVEISNGGLCVDNDGGCNASTTGRISSVTSTVGATDIAEMYSSTQNLEAGEIVMVSGGDFVERSTKENVNKTIGIVSTDPGVILGFGPDATSTIGYPIALAGRVPVKINLEGGEIRKGDRITLSSIPGIGTRATTSGVTIGIALEDFSNLENCGIENCKLKIGTVLVFVNLGWSNLDPQIFTFASSTQSIGGIDMSSGRIKANYVLDMDDHDIVNVRSILSAAGTWSIDENGKLTVDEIHAKKLCLEDICVTKEELKNLLDKAGLPAQAGQVGQAGRLNLFAKEDRCVSPKYNNITIALPFQLLCRSRNKIGIDIGTTLSF